MPLRFPKSVIQTFAIPAALAASPMAVIDTVDFNAGTIMEGKIPIVKYVFKVKNTGDSVLVIQNVKPG